MDRGVRDAERAWREGGRLDDAVRYVAALRRSTPEPPRRWPLRPTDAERSFVAGEGVRGALAVLTCHAAHSSLLRPDAPPLPPPVLDDPGVVFVAAWLVALSEPARLALEVQVVLDVPAIPPAARQTAHARACARLGRPMDGWDAALGELRPYLEREEGRLAHPAYRAALRVAAAEPVVASELEAIALGVLDPTSRGEVSGELAGGVVAALLRDVPVLQARGAVRAALDRVVAAGDPDLLLAMARSFGDPASAPPWVARLLELERQRLLGQPLGNFFPDV